MDIKKIVNENLEFIFPLDYYHFDGRQQDKKYFPSRILNERFHSYSIASILNNENTKKTFEYIKYQKELYNDFYEFYYLLFKLIENNKEDIDKKSSSQNTIIININVWGIEYAKKFIDYCWPSLNTNNNLIYLAKKFDIQIDLFLDKESKDYIFNKLHINYKIIDDKIFSNNYFKEYSYKTRYFLFGSLQNISLYHAKKLNTSVIFLTPDNIYTNSFLKNIVDLALNNNYHAVFGSNTIRVQEESLKSEKNKINFTKIFDNDFNNDDMLEFAFNNLHHDFFKHFININNNQFQNSTFFMTRTKNGMKMNSFWAHPYFISQEYVKTIDKFSFLPLDNKFPHKKDFFEKFKMINDYKTGFTIDIAKKNDTKIEGKFDKSNFINFLISQISDNQFDELNFWFLSQTSSMEFENSFDHFNFYQINSNNLLKNNCAFVERDSEIYNSLIKEVLNIRNNVKFSDTKSDKT